jgi:H+/Cl- antiporter ClcA
LLGVILGGLGVVFNKSILKTQDLYSKIRLIPKNFRIIIPLSFSVILGFFLPQVLGGGHELIITVFNTKNPTLLFLITLLIIKFVFTMLSYGSGAPGGIFLPLLAIGALIGSIYGSVIVNLFGLDKSFIGTFMILAMAGYFTAVVRAPITGTILITEMTGSFHYLLSLALISITAYIIADLLGSRPIYESLLDRFLRNQDDSQVIGNQRHKAILEYVVCMGSLPDGKMVKDVEWPSHSLLVAVRRGGKEIIPKGDTVLQSGDYLIVLTSEDKAPNINDAFLMITSN